jgi:chromosome segregation ATPase
VSALVVARKLKENSTYRECSLSSLEKKCHDVTRTIKRKKEKNKKDLQAYLAMDFLPPKCKDSSTSEAQASLKKENRALKRTIEASNAKVEKCEVMAQAMNEKLNQQLVECHALQDKLVQSRLKEENVTTLNAQLEELRATLDKTLEDYSRLQAAQPALQMKKSKLDYRDGQIKTLKEKLAVSEEENKDMFQTLVVTVSEDSQPVYDRVEKMKEEFENLKNELKKKRRKVNDQQKRLEEFEEERKKCKAEIKDLKIEADQLQDTIEYMESNTISTFGNGRYTDEIRACIMSLVTNCNVSLRKIPDVINAVLSNLTGKLPERLPSPSLISSRIMLEAKYIASNQV